MQDYGKSIIRTIVPVVVGKLLSLLANTGIEIDDPSIIATIDAAVIAAYYSLIRYLESLNPWFGWFIGLPAPPHYEQYVPRRMKRE
jgi:hypothetical protein